MREFLENELLQLYNGICQLELCIQRCDGPERHEMLTVFDAYYGYCKMWQVVRFCTHLALI